MRSLSAQTLTAAARLTRRLADLLRLGSEGKLPTFLSMIRQSDNNSELFSNIGKAHVLTFQINIAGQCRMVPSTNLHRRSRKCAHPNHRRSHHARAVASLILQLAKVTVKSATYSGYSQ
jgi:hypothetical protein